MTWELACQSVSITMFAETCLASARVVYERREGYKTCSDSVLSVRFKIYDLDLLYNFEMNKLESLKSYVRRDMFGERASGL